MEKDLTSGSVIKNLLHLAWPVIVSMGLATMYNFVDTMWIGRLGAVPVAALTVSFMVVLFLLTTSFAITVGTTALIARSVGEKDLSKVNTISVHSFLIASIFGVLSSVIGVLFAEDTLGFLGAEPALISLATDYLIVIFLFSIVYFLTNVIRAILRGVGDTKTTLKITGSCILLNLVLDPILIFGFGPVPALGVKGAAIATVIARVIEVLLGLNAVIAKKKLFKMQRKVCLSFEGVSFDYALVKQILNIGMPVFFSHASMTIGSFLLMKNIALFGSFAIAAYGIAMRLGSLAFLPCLGISAAVTALVGQNLGAKRPGRAERTTWYGAGIVIFFIGVLSIFFFTIPQYLIRVFNSDAAVIAHGILLLKLYSLSLAFRGYEFVITGGFNGAGNTTPVLVINTVKYWIILLPFAYLLSVVAGIGVIGVWLALCLADAFAGTANAFWFSRRRWVNTLDTSGRNFFKATLPPTKRVKQ